MTAHDDRYGCRTGQAPRSTASSGLRFLDASWPDAVIAEPRPMRGLKTGASTPRISFGHAFVQNLRRGPLRTGAPAKRRLAAALAELAAVI